MIHPSRATALNLKQIIENDNDIEELTDELQNFTEENILQKHFSIRLKQQDSSLRIIELVGIEIYLNGIHSD